MELSCKLWGLLLVLSLAQVSRAQLKCYICDNCPDVHVNIPIMDCDEGYFDQNGNNEPSTQTTTDMPTGTTEMPSSTSTSTSDTTPIQTSPEGTTTSTTTTTTESNTSTFSTTTEGATTTETSSTTNTSTPSTTSTTMRSTTSGNVSSTTTEFTPGTTETTTTLETTTTSVVTDTTTSNTSGSTGSTTTSEPQPPTPSTAHPPSSIPTPPNPGVETPIDDFTKYNINGTEGDHNNTKPYIASSQFRLRQTRAVSDYTYHCFKVSASVNNTMIISRGCSRVKASESVCGQWKAENPMEGNVKCYPCSNNRCNGSATLNISLGALAFTLVAAFLHRK